MEMVKAICATVARMALTRATESMMIAMTKSMRMEYQHFPATPSIGSLTLAAPR